MKCPCCGQDVDDAGLLMLKAMPLGGQHRRMLDELIRVYPNGVTHDRLVTVLYHDAANGGADNASQVASIVMSRLRRKVMDLGWAIPKAYKNGVHRLVRL